MIDFRRGRPGGPQPQHFLLEALLPKLGQGQYVPQSVDAPAGVLVAPIDAASYAHRLGNAFFFPDAGLFLDPTLRGGSGSTEYHDVMMPGMNGIDLVDCATERWPSIKVLFTTGFATDAAMRRKTSKHPILSKPFTCDQLTGKVQEILADQ